MTDRMERIGDSLIQHGSNSERIYLMKLASRDCPGIVDKLDDLAARHGYTKIFAKVPVSASSFFLNRGYLAEARIPQLYHGQEEGVMLGKFLQPERNIESHADLVKDVLAKAHAKGRAGRQNETCPSLPEGYVLRSLIESDVEAAAAVYREVFASYPFPIHDPAYLLETMRDHVRYFGVWHEGRLVALASAEMDRTAGHAEMTDFATLPSCRGNGFAQALLAFMEQEIKGDGIRTAFTIARAYSYGMNITFARAGYRFGGTLRNNTQICGRLESMNVWYKPLP
ncbi:putative beta-lysine N-acetyltransferase [Syntrophotalea carbinolica]|nr:putative beta-lysine N-acetyltransferase [Syntrophotalea carbinolica]